MSVLRKFASASATVTLSVLMVGTAAAVSLSWPGHQRHPNIYSDYKDLQASTFFYAPSRVNRLDNATEITVKATAYNLPGKDEYLKVCYTKPYDTAPYACTDSYKKDKFDGETLKVRDKLIVKDSTSPYFGQVAPEVFAKGDFTFIHVFPEGTGGSVFNNRGYDDITVSYEPYRN